MPVRRVGRRRVGAPRRIGRRFGPVRRVPFGRSRAGLRQPVQYFKRTDYLSGFVTATNVSDVYGSYSFALGDVPNVGDFTGLYDQYQIRMIKWQLIPRGNSSDVGTAATSGQNMGVFTALDYDGAAAPTSIDELCQYQNMRMTRSNQIHTRILRPKVRMAGIGAGAALVTTGTYPNNSTWITTGNTTIPHYGILVALQQLPNGTQIYDLKVDYYLAFKNVR